MAILILMVFRVTCKVVPEAKQISKCRGCVLVYYHCTLYRHEAAWRRLTQSGARHRVVLRWFGLESSPFPPAGLQFVELVRVFPVQVIPPNTRIRVPSHTNPYAAQPGGISPLTAGTNHWFVAGK